MLKRNHAEPLRVVITGASSGIGQAAAEPEHNLDQLTRVVVFGQARPRRVVEISVVRQRLDSQQGPLSVIPRRCLSACADALENFRGYAHPAPDARVIVKLVGAVPQICDTQDHDFALEGEEPSCRPKSHARQPN